MEADAAEGLADAKARIEEIGFFLLQTQSHIAKE
jgi:hypothetical protein